MSETSRIVEALRAAEALAYSIISRGSPSDPVPASTIREAEQVLHLVDEVRMAD